MINHSGIKLFETDEMISRFSNALKIIADSTLSFISHGVNIDPIVTKKRRETHADTLYNDIIQWKKDSAMRKTIRDIIIDIFPDRDKIDLLGRDIANISIDNRIRFVYVESIGILNKNDIQKLEIVLTDVLFNYYNIKLIEAKKIRSINISAVTDPRAILSAFQKVKEQNNSIR